MEKNACTGRKTFQSQRLDLPPWLIVPTLGSLVHTGTNDRYSSFHDNLFIRDLSTNKRSHTQNQQRTIKLPFQFFMAKILCTSIGLSAATVYELVQNFCVSEQEPLKAVIITTAHQEKENNKYAILAKEQLQSLGVESVTYLDIASTEASALLDAHICYVCGGNTFTLLQAIKTTTAGEIIRRFLSQENKLYIGVSAGSMILTPTVRLAAEIEPDENRTGLTDLQGLNITNFEIYPHYHNELEEQLAAYEKKYNVTVKRLGNEDYLQLSDFATAKK